MEEIISWLEQSWYILAGVIALLVAVIKSYNVVKNIDKKINEPNEKLEKKLDLVLDSLLSMQRAQILKTCEDYLKLGYATVEQKEALAEQYVNYHALGGNSFITDLVGQVKDLPIEKPKKARKSKEK